MNQQGVPILALLATACLAADPAAADSALVIAAHETRVNVAPHDAGLRLINLPAIEFGLRAAIRCRGVPASLTLSVSDTFKSVGAERLDGQRAVETTLTVPPRQMTLAVSRQFCISNDDNSVNELLVPGFITAHASLRCDKDGFSTMHFASAPLQLRLACERPPAQDRQDESEDSSAEDM
ncbi:MAG: hypothetical protein QNJ11_05145 [Woeseiaceae bacterium]|nr:hypothetical protein [Woeseiaceae bacterium]